MLNTVDEVIEAIGGDGPAMALACVTASAVSNWRSRGKISQENFFIFRDALAAFGKEPNPSVFGFKVPDDAEART